MSKRNKKSKLPKIIMGVILGLFNTFLYAFIIKWICDANAKHVFDKVVFVTLFVIFGVMIIGLIEMFLIKMPMAHFIEKKYNDNDSEESIRESIGNWSLLPPILLGHFVFKSIIGTNLILNILMIFSAFGMTYAVEFMGGNGERKHKKVTATTINYGSHLSTTKYKDEDGNSTTVEHWKF